MFTSRCIAASAAILMLSNAAFAGSSVQVYGSAKKYDQKIEAAAIKKAASKIGELRGSLEGLSYDHITTEKDLKYKQSSLLGFPKVQEKSPLSGSQKAIPIV